MRLVLLTMLAALVAASPQASAAPPQEGAERRAWDALDFEAKWLRYRGDAGSHAPWVKFLGAAKEFELLEWIALTKREDVALEELLRLDAPHWIRCAVWRLDSEDSHSVGGAAKGLIEENHPALVLDWFNRHPEAVKGGAKVVVKQLREHQPPLVPESSGSYLPPLDPEVVLKSLKPPATVFDHAAQRKRAADDVYVHQVLRALDSWELSTLKGPAWTSRVLALLRHGHPEVRRGAALACSAFPPDEIPVATLDAIADSETEAPAVRAAAVVATSYVPGPERYLRLHDLAQRPTHAGWSAAVSRLADRGDEFSLILLEALPTDSLDAPARTLLLDTVKRVRDGLRGEEPSARARRFVQLLDGAALADLSGSPMRKTLVPTAIAAVRAHIAEFEVREMVEELRADAASKDPAHARRAEFAAKILEPGPPPKDVKPPK
jgi:hypothetical protein